MCVVVEVGDVHQIKFQTVLQPKQADPESPFSSPSSSLPSSDVRPLLGSSPPSMTLRLLFRREKMSPLRERLRVTAAFIWAERMVG